MDQRRLPLQIPPFLDFSSQYSIATGIDVLPVSSLSDPSLSLCPPLNHQSSNSIQNSVPFDFDSYPHPHVHDSSQPHSLLSPVDLSLFFSNSPSNFSLPVYSTSGFDILNILASVATRPNPCIQLGPVDLTCAFVVVDVHRHDHPIVYCSPSFCSLTGYHASEVLGRNCRFLQSPGGDVVRGEHRQFTSHHAVSTLKKALSADKECQTTLINYRKDGSPFMNLVTVIPVPASSSQQDIAFHVGFQVDLTQPPATVLEKFKATTTSHPQPLLRDRKLQSASIAAVHGHHLSIHLRRLLADPAFIRSIPISSSTTIPASSSSSSVDALTDSLVNSLHLILLEASPDFIHVVSLKGSFLYVAPAVRRVLGYEPDEMVGKAIADYAHPEDVIPLMRELKESSATGISVSADSSTTPTLITTTTASSSASMAPRTVDLLFRARTKAGVYVWVESRGRLYVEPGKGRKAIILSGRARAMPHIPWDPIFRARAPFLHPLTKQRAFWGTLSPDSSLTFLSVASSVYDVLGWTQEDLIGRTARSFLLDSSALEKEVQRFRSYPHNHVATASLNCSIRAREYPGSSVVTAVPILLLLFAPSRDPLVDASTLSIGSISPAPIIYQVSRLEDSSPDKNVNITHPLLDNIFHELDITRGSSWQYELQQLKFTNQRLADEVAALEAQVRVGDLKQELTVKLAPPSLTPPPLTTANENDWWRSNNNNTLWTTLANPQPCHPQSSLKRTWAVMDNSN